MAKKTTEKKITKTTTSKNDLLDRIDEKLDRINDKLEKIVAVQASQQAILDEHIRRTEQLENALSPMKAQQNQIMGGVKLIGIIGTITTIIVALSRII